MHCKKTRPLFSRMTEEFYNKGNIESAGQFFAGAYVHHDPASPHVTDLAGFKQSLRTNLAGCPDLYITANRRAAG